MFICRRGLANNEDFRLYKPHPMIMGNEMGNESSVVSSPHLSFLMWLGVVSFSFPPFSVHHFKHAIGIKDVYVASGWAWSGRPMIVHMGKSMARALR